MSAYSAHADLCTVVHEHDAAEMLQDVHEIFPEISARPISGDMIALIRRGTRPEVARRRKRAAVERREA